MNKKFELVKENYIPFKGRKLYQIRALREIQNERMIVSIKKGELGGYVESEKNLSQEGNSWICQSARVYDNATVEDGALVGNKVIVRGNAIIEDIAYVRAMQHGKTIIEDNARIGGDSTVGSEDPFVSYNTTQTAVCGDSVILGNSIIERIHVNDSLIRNAHIVDAQLHDSIIYGEPGKRDLFIASAFIQNSILYRSCGKIEDSNIQSSVHAGQLKILGSSIHGGEFYNPLIKEDGIEFPSTNFKLFKERVRREITNVIKFGRVPKEISWKGEFPRIKTKEEVLEDYKNDPAPFRSFFEYGVKENGEMDWVTNPSEIKNYQFFIDVDKVYNFCYNPPLTGLKLYPEHGFPFIPSSENLTYILCYKKEGNGRINTEKIDNPSTITQEWKEGKGFDETGYVFIITVEKK